MSNKPVEQSKQNVWLVTVDEPVFYGRLYCRLLNSPSHNIKGIVLLPAINAGSWKKFFKDVKYRYQLWGLKGFMYAVWLMIKAKLFSTGDVLKVAKKQGLPTYRCDNVEQASKVMQEHCPDIVISTVVEKISSAVLNSVPGGWVNTHCSALPKYAGMDAPFWCLYNGEKELGVTMHYMNEEFDKGPIIRQQLLVNDNASYFATVMRLFDAAYHLHIDFQQSFTPTIAKAQPQNMSQYSYYSKPKAKLGKAFRKRGGKIV